MDMERTWKKALGRACLLGIPQFNQAQWVNDGRFIRAWRLHSGCNVKDKYVMNYTTIYKYWCSFFSITGACKARVSPFLPICCWSFLEFLAVPFPVASLQEPWSHWNLPAMPLANFRKERRAGCRAAGFSVLVAGFIPFDFFWWWGKAQLPVFFPSQGWFEMFEFGVWRWCKMANFGNLSMGEWMIFQSMGMGVTYVHATSLGFGPIWSLQIQKLRKGNEWTLQGGCQPLALSCPSKFDWLYWHFA